MNDLTQSGLPRVSILTRPGGRVQHEEASGVGGVRRVSILTRPGGRVQLQRVATRAKMFQFQSSPVPEDGCNGGKPTSPHEVNSFNPHPSRRTGATPMRVSWRSVQTAVSILTRPGGRVQLKQLTAVRGVSQFQSSPVPEDGCNQTLQRTHGRGCGFNPHPSRRTGATG